MKLSKSIMAITSTLVVIAIAAYLFLPLTDFKRRLVRQFSSTPALAALGIDIQQTSVSGVSSGAAMALQMHVAHSSIMRGAGIIAGVAYECTDSHLPVDSRLLRGLDCIQGDAPYGGPPGAAFSIDRTTDAASVAGAIDDPAVNLPRQKVWLFSGYNDGSVRRGAMDAAAGYYEHYVNPNNIFYKNNNHAPHALVTDNYGGPCLGFNHDFVNNCNYDMAGNLLKHIYGDLQRNTGTPTGSILEFEQNEFVSGQDPSSVGLADIGYVYVPMACRAQTCRVHVVFHGCEQYAGRIGDAIYRHGGYNQWADMNKLVMLYPQTEENLLFNPKGCWDWWGLKQDLPLNGDFARKTGYQISAVKAMLDRLAQNFVPTAGSDTFGTPQNFSGRDSTAASVALIWQANSAAAGFNVYRSSSSTGPFTKLNSTLLTGASFADRQLSHSTTYYYQVRAVDQLGSESAPSGTVAGMTTAEPSPCDPYFSNNAMHEIKFRAYPYLVWWSRAWGSNDDLGWNTITTLNQLIKEGPAFYRKAYCP